MNSNFNHVMLDIETLGQGANSVITSIAAVSFNPRTGEYGESFHTYVNIQSCIDFDLDIEPDTVIWWLKQSEVARDLLVKGNMKSVPLFSALSGLANFFLHLSLTVAPIEDIIVWGRGPRFDMGILSNAYQKSNLPIPWNFRNEMCVRTMEYLRPDIKKRTIKVDNTGHGSEGGGAHDAMSDCLYQIAYVSAILKHIK